MSYEDLLRSKLPRAEARGMDVSADDLAPALFDYQRHCVEFALRVGSASTAEACAATAEACAATAERLGAWLRGAHARASAAVRAAA